MTMSDEWTQGRILGVIRDRKMTLAKLAEAHGRNPGSFGHIWKRPNQINEQIIADFLGVPVEEVWPDRYPKDSHRVFDSKKWSTAEGQKALRGADRVAA